MQIIKKAAAAIIAAAAMTGLIVYSGEVSQAVEESIERCIKIIVPSLFAFMAVSRLLISSGAAEQLSRPLDLTLGKLLKMPRGGTAVFVLSNIAGYPVGASMLTQLRQQGRIGRRSAEAMSIYCYAAGPAYLINAAGLGIYGSRTAGLSLFLSVFTANIILAAAINRIYKPELTPAPANGSGLGGQLVSSVTSAGEAMFDMCLMIVFFSALLAAAEASGAFTAIDRAFGLSRSSSVLLRSVFEITASSQLSPSSIGALPALAAACSFGGLCVIFQLRSVIGNSYSLKLFFIWLPIRAALVFLLCKMYDWILLDNYLPTFTQSEQLIVELDNFLPSLCLIMMIFILVFQKRLDFLKRV